MPASRWHLTDPPVSDRYESASNGAGVRDGRAATQSEHWLRENRAAMEGWNAYVEQHGLPLAAFRLF